MIYVIAEIGEICTYNKLRLRPMSNPNWRKSRTPESEGTEGSRSRSARELENLSQTLAYTWFVEGFLAFSKVEITLEEEAP